MRNKDYVLWYKKKKQINRSEYRLKFHEREVRFAFLGKNVGREQDGDKNFVRPVIVLKKFNDEMCWILPLTRQSGEPKYYYKLNFGIEDSFAILSQMKTIDSRRLSWKISNISLGEFRILRQKIREFIP